MKLINGWTKAKVMEQVKKYNNGSRALINTETLEACVYRSNDGNRCAVGCFIPDGHPALKADLTKVTAYQLLDRYEDLAKYMPFSRLELGIFQQVHDVNKDRYTDKPVWRAIEEFLYSGKVEE